MRRKIDEALDRVSEREKIVFLLRHYHDLSLKEIAEALGLTIGSVKLERIDRTTFIATGGGREGRHWCQASSNLLNVET